MKRRIDQTSRKTIGRFSLKFVFAFILAALAREAFFLVISRWLSLYAIMTTVIGLLVRDRIEPRSLNHWDEVLWLSGAAMAFMILHRAG